MTQVPLGIGNRTVAVPSHVCLFYYDDPELRSRLGFVRLGLESPDQAVVLFGAPERLERVCTYLAEDFHRDVAADRAEGQLVLIGGERDPQVLLANIGGTLDTLAKRGTRLIRFMGFISWGDDRWPNARELLAFESTVNEAATRFPAVVMCTYNVAELPGPILMMGGVATHPLTIVGTTLCENPHYISTAEFLGNLDDAAGRPWWEAVRVGPLPPVSERAAARARR